MKFDKSHIFVFILSAIIFGSIGSICAYKLGANQVGYEPSDDNWNVEAVDTALDDLYDMASFGDATSSDIVSGKKALVGGSQVTGSLTVPNYTTLTAENVAAGSSSTTRTGYYYLDNYKVICGTTTCPSYATLYAENVSAGSSSTARTGYYYLSNYKVTCGSCGACNSCCGNGSYTFLNNQQKVTLASNTSTTYTFPGSYSKLVAVFLRAEKGSTKYERIISPYYSSEYNYVVWSAFNTSVANSVLNTTETAVGTTMYFSFSGNTINIRNTSSTSMNVYFFLAIVQV